MATITITFNQQFLVYDQFQTGGVPGAELGTRDQDSGLSGSGKDFKVTTCVMS